MQIKRDDAVYWVIVGYTLLNAIPLKSANALVTLLLVIAYCVIFPKTLLTKRVILSGVLLVINLAHIFYLKSEAYTVNIPGYVWGFLTHAPFALLLFKNPLTKFSDDLRFRVNKFFSIYIIVQFVLGVIQFVLSGNVDCVCGTFGLLDFRTGNITISQVWFTFNILGICFYLISQKDLNKLGFVSVLIGFITVVLAQSGHQLIFLCLPMAILLSRYLTNIKLLFVSIAAGTIVVVSAIILVPETYSVGVSWFERIVQNDNSPKKASVQKTLDWHTAEPTAVVFGLGFGQYLTRASMIASNVMNSKRKLPASISGHSTFARDFEVPMKKMLERGEGSAMSKPYFSLLNLYSEFGVLGVLSLIGYLIYVGIKGILNKNPFTTFHLSTIAFLIACSAIENYFEFTQALIIPFLLITLTSNNTIPISKDRKSEVAK
ncbi:hypothetical protein MLD52_01945 [Puniceicoccaceae bacterium K14]|nr:hypothetical protein [Puniceicoccaceae bacterium K14]